ncbi:FMN reductase (NADH) RutF [Gluconacetobacter liquefaciens]|nr:flavin reductase [Gluconacetobacter liquefaciens]RDI36862.1 flavin reductase [Gluconacetobacter liquefaciens]GBQ94174.1 flavin mononucleotide reductase [Gluconacetobacter liquefaciens NRIC 0522]GEB39368.1 FMN reductase (NADH) RutF [Gluconacetobacter liquefaciens]
MSAPTPDISVDAFRAAMSQLGAPVVVVTTDGQEGRHGLTVSAVCSVSDTPPTLLVCLNRSNRSYAAFAGNRVLGFNILGEGDQALAAAFASSRLQPEERFSHGTWHQAVTGAPLLDGAVVSLDCTVEAVHVSGTHDVLMCHVKAIRHGADDIDVLTWFDRRFHVLPRTKTMKRPGFSGGSYL